MILFGSWLFCLIICLKSHRLSITKKFNITFFQSTFDPGYTQARFNSCCPNFTVFYKMDYKIIKRKLAKAPKYSTLTGKEPAMCRPVRLEHNEDVFAAHVLAMFSGNEVS